MHVQPTVPGLSVEDDGHPVEQMLNCGIRSCGQDRAAEKSQLLVSGPEPREAKQLMVGQVDQVGVFAAVIGFRPLVVTVRRDQAAAPFERITEGGLFCGIL